MMLKPNLQIDIKFIFRPGATAFKQVRTPSDKTKDNWKPKRNLQTSLEEIDNWLHWLRARGSILSVQITSQSDCELANSQSVAWSCLVTDYWQTRILIGHTEVTESK